MDTLIQEHTRVYEEQARVYGQIGEGLQKIRSSYQKSLKKQDEQLSVLKSIQQSVNLLSSISGIETESSPDSIPNLISGESDTRGSILGPVPRSPPQMMYRSLNRNSIYNPVSGDGILGPRPSTPPPSSPWVNQVKSPNPFIDNEKLEDEELCYSDESNSGTSVEIGEKELDFNVENCEVKVPDLGILEKIDFIGVDSLKSYTESTFSGMGLEEEKLGFISSEDGLICRANDDRYCIDVSAEFKFNIVEEVDFIGVEMVKPPLGVGRICGVEYEKMVFMSGARMVEVVVWDYGYMGVETHFAVAFMPLNYVVVRCGQMVKVDVQFDPKKFKKKDVCRGVVISDGECLSDVVNVEHTLKLEGNQVEVQGSEEYGALVNEKVHGGLFSELRDWNQYGVGRVYALAKEQISIINQIEMVSSTERDGIKSGNFRLFNGVKRELELADKELAAQELDVPAEVPTKFCKVSYMKSMEKVAEMGRVELLEVEEECCEDLDGLIFEFEFGTEYYSVFSEEEMKQYNTMERNHVANVLFTLTHATMSSNAVLIVSIDLMREMASWHLIEKLQHVIFDWKSRRKVIDSVSVPHELLNACSLVLGEDIAVVMESNVSDLCKAISQDFILWRATLQPGKHKSFARASGSSILLKFQLVLPLSDNVNISVVELWNYYSQAQFHEYVDARTVKPSCITILNQFLCLCLACEQPILVKAYWSNSLWEFSYERARTCYFIDVGDKKTTSFGEKIVVIFSLENGFDKKFVNHFAHKFERKNKKNLCGIPCALRRMKTVGERASITLLSTVQSIIETNLLNEGIQFYSTITHERFEDLSVNSLRKSIEPVEKCLIDSKEDKSIVQDVVLVDESTRILEVQGLLLLGATSLYLEAKIVLDTISKVIIEIASEKLSPNALSAGLVARNYKKRASTTLLQAILDGYSCSNSEKRGDVLAWNWPRRKKLCSFDNGSSLCFSPNVCWSGAATEPSIKAWELRSKNIVENLDLDLKAEAYKLKLPQTKFYNMFHVVLLKRLAQKGLSLIYMSYWRMINLFLSLNALLALRKSSMSV